MGRDLAIDVLEAHDCPDCTSSLQSDGLENDEHHDYEKVTFIRDNYTCPNCGARFTLDAGDKGGGATFQIVDRPD